MKKGVTYIGGDEEYIPKNEKNVDESLNSDKENEKRAKRFGIGYLIFMSIPIIIFIILAAFMVYSFNNINNKYDQNIKGNKYTFTHLQGTQNASSLIGYLDDIITNNKLDAYTDITVIYNGESAITENEILSIKNQISDTSKNVYEVSVDYADPRGYAINKITIKDKVVEQSAYSFNLDIKNIEGEKYGADWRLDNVIKSNKNNDKHIIEVIYQEKTYISEDEIIELKRLLDKWTKYQYSLDYDEKGYINKITIKDI